MTKRYKIAIAIGCAWAAFAFAGRPKREAPFVPKAATPASASPEAPVTATWASPAPPSPASTAPADLTGLRLVAVRVFPCEPPITQPSEWFPDGTVKTFAKKTRCQAGLAADAWKPGRDVAYIIRADSAVPNGPVFWTHEVGK